MILFAAQRSFRIPEQDANLFAELIGENAYGPGFVRAGGELAQHL